MTELEDQIAILAELSESLEKYPQMAEWLVWHNVSVPIALLVSMGIFEMNKIAERYMVYRAHHYQAS